MIVKCKVSGWKDVLSGVPQGSVLGPVLFSIFINDLNDTASNIRLIQKFADDTKAGHTVCTQEQADELQDCLDRMHRWSLEWGMMFNAEKCKVMHLGRTNQRFQYSMGGVTLGSTDEEKDVGVIIHHSLKPKKQCAKAAQTARSVL